MSLFDTISADLITAIKSRNQADMRSLQGIKAQLLLLRTEKGTGHEISSEDEMKVLMRMAKQRRDSIDIFAKEGRNDLVDKEKEELTVIEKYLPTQMSDEDLAAKIKSIIEKSGASSMAQMGMVMGMASKELAGQADGKRISEWVKKLLGA